MGKNYQLRIDYAKNISPEFKIYLKKRVTKYIISFYNKKYRDILENHLLLAGFADTIDADYIFEHDLIYYVYIMLRYKDNCSIGFLVGEESNDISKLFNLLNLDTNE